jgi:nicotinamide-nucleotide amidase
MKIEIVTVGDELLLGFTIDTNAAFLARELASVGVEVARRTTVGDVAGEIADAVKAALERTGAVITTGGLGPTSDDLTKPAIASIFGRRMYHDAAVMEGIEELFRSRGFPGPIPESNRVQAMIPEGARVLRNRHGSAPGIWLEDDRGRWVAMLPGVPREMKGMFADTILPLMLERTGAARTVVCSRTLRTTGIAEAALADRIADLVNDMTPLSLAFLPGTDGVDLRLTCRDVDPATADAILAGVADRLLQRVGDRIYGEGTSDLAGVVVDMCRRRDMRIAVGESCTGGLVGARLTAIPGSSAVFVGGVIAYDDDVKIDLLGVDRETIARHGAVSEPVVRMMASGARVRFGTAIGIAVSGIAGPGGGTPDKPVGTVWIAVDVEGNVTATGRGYSGDREEIRSRAAQAALDMVRRAVVTQAVPERA